MNKFLYIFNEIDTNKYKIGVSVNIEKRLKQLNTGNANKLQCIYSLETSIPFALERNIHQLLKEYNIENSEWFIFEKEQLSTIIDKINKSNNSLSFLKKENLFCENFK